MSQDRARFGAEPRHWRACGAHAAPLPPQARAKHHLVLRRVVVRSLAPHRFEGEVEGVAEHREAVAQLRLEPAPSLRFALGRERERETAPGSMRTAPDAPDSP